MIKSLSASGLSTWLQCGLKFKFIYHDHIKRRTTEYFKFGNAIHKALEFAALENMDYSREIDSDFRNVVINIYIEEAARLKLEDVELLNEGVFLIDKKLDDFEFGKRVISVEEGFEVDLGVGVPIVGRIDKIVELSSDSLAIIDYKTSRIGLTGLELKKDIQLSLYDLIVSHLYPNYSKRVLILDYLRFRPVYTYRSDSERELFLKFLLKVIKEIENTDPSDLTANINKYCAACDYKFLCPSYQEVISNSTYQPVDVLSDSELVREFEYVKNSLRVLNERMSELKMILSDRFKVEHEIVGDGKKIVPRQNSRKFYDSRLLLSKIPKKDLANLISFKTYEVDKYLKSKGEKFEKIVKASTRYVLTRPWFDVVDI